MRIAAPPILALFHSWMQEAKSPSPTTPMPWRWPRRGRTHPNVRMVLLKGANAMALCFIPNEDSIKGGEWRPTPGPIISTGKVCARRAAEGTVVQVSDAEADAISPPAQGQPDRAPGASPQSRGWKGACVRESIADMP